jgi:integrase
MCPFIEPLKPVRSVQAMRSGEAWRLRWKDIDPEHGIVTVNNPEKNGLPRQFKVTSKLIAMLNSLPKVNEKIWNGNIHCWTSNFIAQRNRISRKLQNPRIKDILPHAETLLRDHALS